MKDTLVAILLDATGSMWEYRAQTLSGYNEYLDGLREQKNYHFLLTQFNSNAIKIGEVMPIADAPHLTSEEYQPNANTPLYDAIGKTINHIQNLKQNYNVLLVILTDGLENASKEYTKAGTADLIKSLENKGWTTVYLGANQDSFAEAGSLGISVGNTRNYLQAQTREAFGELTRGSVAYAASASMPTQNFWDNENQGETYDAESE